MTPSAAAGAYAALTSAALPAADAGKAAGEGFAGLLDAAVSGFAETGRAAEQTGIQAMTGNADPVDLVTAIAETELALESVVAVRDRVIQAYEEIMRMPI